jgi:hypothetical protein
VRAAQDSFLAQASPAGDATYDFLTPSGANHFYADLNFGAEQERALFSDLFSRPVKFEVKSDRKCFRTGNIAVEYRKRAADGSVFDSGLSVTDAEIYVFVLGPKTRLLVPTDRVKLLARRAILEGRERWIGDENRFLNALVPVDWFFGWGEL